jgi:Arc/MetJ-type ribon-helix-helix transcriptional regulator
MTTVRLPADIEQKLELVSSAKHVTKSELIKEALELLFSREEREKDSFELGEERFGRYGSGRTDLSTNYKLLLKEKISAKSSTR